VKLRKRLILLEDFKTKTTDATNVTEVPVNKTKNTSTRNDVIADVDAILNNLETLSAQITEEVDAILENTDWYAETLNESFMEEMIKTFKSMKSYARLSSSWPRMYQDKLDLEIEAVTEIGAFELDSLEMEEKMTAAVKAKFDAKKKEITASDIPTEKKKAAREAVNGAYEEKEADIKAKIKKQIDAKKAVMINKQKQSADKQAAEMSEFESENQIESDLVKKRWERSKVEQTSAMDNAHITAKSEAELEFMDADNPDAIKKYNDRMSKMKTDMKAEDAAKIKEIQDDLKSAEAEAEERANAGSDKEKAANAKILTFYKSGSALRDGLKSTNPEDYDDAAKLNIKKLKGAFNDAEAKVSGTVFVDGGVAADKMEGEEIAEGLKKDIKELLADFKEVLDLAGGSKSDLEKATEAAKEAVDTAQDNLDTEELTEDDDKIKAAKIKLLDAKIAHETTKKAEAADAGEDVEKFDTKIAEHEEAKKLLDTDPPATEKTSKQLADEFITDNEGFKVITDKGAEVPVTNPDTEEEEQKPKYEGEQDFTGKKEDGSDDDVVTVGKEIDYTNNTDESKTVEEVAKESIGDGFDEYKKIPVGEQDQIHPERTGDDGIAIPGRAMWTDKKGPFKAKDETGAETGPGVFYGKPQSSESVATVTGPKLNEGMSISEKFAILMNK
jgi:enamine deaminase RidA (YjgF/YER057c/UK114 family)